MKNKSSFWLVVLLFSLTGFVAENVYGQPAGTIRSELKYILIQLVSEVEGTILLNGSGTGFFQDLGNTVKEANNNITITINNPISVLVSEDSNLAFSVRDAEGNIHSTITRTTTSVRGRLGDLQYITRITIKRNQTAPAQATRPAVAANDNLSTPNSPNDFEIANSSLGGVKITKYIGTRQNVVIPSTIDSMRVTEIGAFAFTNKTLNGVVFPNTLIEIGEGAFSGQSLTSISFPSSLRKIHRRAFRGNKFTNIIIPNGVIYVGISAFEENPIETLVIPQSLANYSKDTSFNHTPPLGFSSAFDGTRLNSVTLPANVNNGNFESSIELNNFINPFEGGLYNTYVGNGKKAGTYVWTGRIWRVE